MASDPRRTSVLVDALYSRAKETLTGVDTRTTIDTYDAHLGITWKRAFNTVVQPYFGLEVIPTDGGSTKTAAVERAVSRDGIVNVRAGCLFQVTTGLSFRPELIAGGESTVSVTGGYAF